MGLVKCLLAMVCSTLLGVEGALAGNIGVTHQAYAEAQNDKTAVKWYASAAKQGNALAQYDLGVIYDTAIGVAANPKLAMQWYFAAAQQVHAQTQFNLAVSYAKSKGVLGA